MPRYVDVVVGSPVLREGPISRMEDALPAGPARGAVVAARSANLNVYVGDRLDMEPIVRKGDCALLLVGDKSDPGLEHFARWWGGGATNDPILIDPLRTWSVPELQEIANTLNQLDKRVLVIIGSTEEAAEKPTYALLSQLLPAVVSRRPDAALNLIQTPRISKKTMAEQIDIGEEFDERAGVPTIHLYPINTLSLSWATTAFRMADPPPSLRQLDMTAAEDEAAAILIKPVKGKPSLGYFGFLSQHPQQALDLQDRVASSSPDTHRFGRQQSTRLVALPSKGNDLHLLFPVPPATNDTEGTSLVGSRTVVAIFYYDLARTVMRQGQQVYDIVMHAPMGAESFENFFIGTPEQRKQWKKEKLPADKRETPFYKHWRDLVAQDQHKSFATMPVVRFLSPSRRKTVGEYYGAPAPYRSLARERWEIRRALTNIYVDPTVLRDQYTEAFGSEEDALSPFHDEHVPPPPLMMIPALAALNPAPREFEGEMKWQQRVAARGKKFEAQAAEARVELAEKAAEKVGLARRLLTLDTLAEVSEDARTLADWRRAVTSLRRVDKIRVIPFFPAQSIVALAARGFGPVSIGEKVFEYQPIGPTEIVTADQFMEGLRPGLAVWNQAQAADLKRREAEAKKAKKKEVRPPPMPFAVAAAAIIDKSQLKAEYFKIDVGDTQVVSVPHMKAAKEIARKARPLGSVAHEEQFALVFGNLWGDRFFPTEVSYGVAPVLLKHLVNVDIGKSRDASSRIRTADTFSFIPPAQNYQSPFRRDLLLGFCGFPNSRLGSACKSIERRNEDLQAKGKKTGIVPENEIPNQAYIRTIRYGVGEPRWDVNPEEMQAPRRGSAKTEEAKQAQQARNAAYVQMRAGLRDTEFKLRPGFMPPSSIARLGESLVSDLFNSQFYRGVSAKPPKPLADQLEEARARFEEAARRKKESVDEVALKAYLEQIRRRYEQDQKAWESGPSAKVRGYAERARDFYLQGVQHSAQPRSNEEEELLVLFAQYSLAVPTREKFSNEMDYLRAMENAFMRLRDAMSMQYEHSFPPADAGFEAQEEEDDMPRSNRWDAPYDLLWQQLQEKRPEGDELYDPEEIMSFRERSFAQLNPDGRRPRRERRERRSRRESRYARENPIVGDEVTNVFETLSPKKRKDPNEVDRLRALLESTTDAKSPYMRDFGESEPDPYRHSRVTQTFPRGRFSEDPEKARPVSLSELRLGNKKTQENLLKYDLVTRLAEQFEPPETKMRWSADEEFASSPDSGAFWTKGTIPTTLSEKAELSLPEAATILRKQEEAKRRMQARTVPASTALCQANRVRRLKEYRPPYALMAAGGDGWQKKVVLWVSPAVAPEFRVMTFRRNTHIDCDMTATNGRQPLDVVSTAIQSALYWLAENPERMKRGTVLYIGRIGVPSLRPLWKAQDDFNSERVLPLNAATIRAVLSDDIVHGRQQHEVNLLDYGYDPAKDVNNYLNAMAWEVRRRNSRKGIAPPLETQESYEKRMGQESETVVEEDDEYTFGGG